MASDVHVRILFVACLFLGACAKGSDGSDTFDMNGVMSGQPGAAGAGSVDGSTQGTASTVNGVFINTGDATAPDPDAGKSPVDPSKVVKTEMGGYELGPEITMMMTNGKVDTGLNASEQGCGTVVGIVRDFKGYGEQGGHVDFESYKGDGVSPGLVANTLGSDNKPVYTGLCEAQNPPMATCPFGQETSSKIAFESWYHTMPPTNRAFLVYLIFAQNGSLATIDSQLFFPLDNAGFGNSGMGEDHNPHNFDFTTELHTKFKYVGGEVFTFQGDDDLWVFINGKLAIDLGGLHEARMAMVDLDASAAMLGLTKDKVYNFDLFHAERHQIGSHFHVDTTLTFSDCGDIPAR
jgi:fibro-slime domain-containing protein